MKSIEKFDKALSALQKRGFVAQAFSTREEAVSYVANHIPAGSMVGIGGSMTVKEAGLVPRLESNGCEVLWHWDVPVQERRALFRRILGQAQAYVCSANAICEDGTIVNIDGTGNRLAALCYGPDQVFILAGRNKLVFGTVNQAVARAKREACTRNARRFGLDTPCAAAGACRQDACTYAMCSITALFQRASGDKTTHVLLIDEDLGF